MSSLKASANCSHESNRVPELARQGSAHENESWLRSNTGVSWWLVLLWHRTIVDSLGSNGTPAYGCHNKQGPKPRVVYTQAEYGDWLRLSVASDFSYGLNLTD